MIWPVNFHQLSTFLEKVTFWDYCVNELIFWRYVLKSFSLSGVLPQGLLFPRNIHSCRIYWCPSAAECKSSLYFSISRGVFEGRCHQVPKITIQNGPRQIRRNKRHSKASISNTVRTPTDKSVWGIRGPPHTHQRMSTVAETTKYLQWRQSL